MISSASRRIFKKVADTLADNGFDAVAETGPNDQPCITIAGRGRYYIMAEL